MPNRNRENDEGSKTYQVIVYEVEAMKVSAANAAEVARWCGGDVATDIHPVDRTIRFSKVGIPTMKGVLWACDGDYVVKWPGAGFTKMTKSEFEGLFEPAKEDDE